MHVLLQPFDDRLPSRLISFLAMVPCRRCGNGTRSGRGKGWCSNRACREAEKKEKQEEKRLRQAKKEEKQEEKRLRGQKRQRVGAGGRGPCPGEGVSGPGRPADTEEVQAEKLEARGFR